MQKELKSAIVHIRLRPSLKQAADRAAEADNRSLTGLIEKLLTQHVESVKRVPVVRG